MLNAHLGAEDTPENREIALQQFGVIDNPATTTVTLFGPLDLIRNGTPNRWIVDRFNRCEPVTLNSYNLEGIDAVGLRPGYETDITSENAAPFHELVEEHPNAAIIDRHIETTLTRCGPESILSNRENLKPLSASQLQRGRHIINTNPHFKFKEALQLTLELGGWQEQEKQ